MTQLQGKTQSILELHIQKLEDISTIFKRSLSMIVQGIKRSMIPPFSTRNRQVYNNKLKIINGDWRLSQEIAFEQIFGQGREASSFALIYK